MAVKVAPIALIVGKVHRNIRDHAAVDKGLLDVLPHQLVPLLKGQFVRQGEPPTLIVTSPYLLTRQTAGVTIQRFPDVPVEVWSIDEFTYLQPSRWDGTRGSERMPHL